MRAFLALAVIALSGCASWQKREPEPAIAVVDVPVLASDAAAFIAAQLPAAASTVWVAPAPSDVTGVLADAVAGELRGRGFAVSEGDDASAGVAVRLAALSVGADALLTLDLGADRASRWFKRAPSGDLEAASSYTIRRAQ